MISLFSYLSGGGVLMLKISKLADYATVIMHWLSQHDSKYYSATAIAEQIGVGLPTVSKVLKSLNDAGLVSSLRGAQGGYQLSRAAAEISVADIITALDGRPAMTECSQVDSICQYDARCELRGNWQYLNARIYHLLNSVSLYDMTMPLIQSKGTLPFLSARQPQECHHVEK
jgi:FeS assembly SUF system regulator